MVGICAKTVRPFKPAFTFAVGCIILALSCASIALPWGKQRFVVAASSATNTTADVTFSLWQASVSYGSTTHTASIDSSCKFTVTDGQRQSPFEFELGSCTYFVWMRVFMSFGVFARVLLFILTSPPVCGHLKKEGVYSYPIAIGLFNTFSSNNNVDSEQALPIAAVAMAFEIIVAVSWVLSLLSSALVRSQAAKTREDIDIASVTELNTLRAVSSAADTAHLPAALACMLLHEHPLIHDDFSTRRICDICDAPVQVAYRCAACDFDICVSCVDGTVASKTDTITSATKPLLDPDCVRALLGYTVADTFIHACGVRHSREPVGDKVFRAKVKPAAQQDVELAAPAAVPDSPSKDDADSKTHEHAHERSAAAARVIKDAGAMKRFLHSISSRLLSVICTGHILWLSLLQVVIHSPESFEPNNRIPRFTAYSYFAYLFVAQAIPAAGVFGGFLSKMFPCRAIVDHTLNTFYYLLCVAILSIDLLTRMPSLSTADFYGPNFVTYSFAVMIPVVILMKHDIESLAPPVGCCRYMDTHAVSDAFGKALLAVIDICAMIPILNLPGLPTKLTNATVAFVFLSLFFQAGAMIFLVGSMTGSVFVNEKELTSSKFIQGAVLVCQDIPFFAIRIAAYFYNASSLGIALMLKNVGNIVTAAAALRSDD